MSRLPFLRFRSSRPQALRRFSAVAQWTLARQRALRGDVRTLTLAARTGLKHVQQTKPQVNSAFSSRYLRCARNGRFGPGQPGCQHPTDARPALWPARCYEVTHASFVSLHRSVGALSHGPNRFRKEGSGYRHSLGPCPYPERRSPGCASTSHPSRTPPEHGSFHRCRSSQRAGGHIGT